MGLKIVWRRLKNSETYENMFRYVHGQMFMNHKKNKIYECLDVII